MAVEVFDAVLKLAVLGLVEILDDPRSCRLGTLKVSFDVFDKYGQALGPGTEPSRTGFSRFRLLNHDVSIADMQLRPVDWLPITGNAQQIRKCG